MGYYNFPHTRNFDSDLGFLIAKYIELGKDYESLVNYVESINNQIETIATDVSIEKINELLQDGTFENLINDKLFDTMYESFEKMYNTMYESFEEMYNESETRIQELENDVNDDVTALNNRINSLTTLTPSTDTEIQDARTQFDGEISASLHDSIVNSEEKIINTLKAISNSVTTLKLQVGCRFEKDGLFHPYNACCTIEPIYAHYLHIHNSDPTNYQITVYEVNEKYEYVNGLINKSTKSDIYLNGNNYYALNIYRPGESVIDNVVLADILNKITIQNYFDCGNISYKQVKNTGVDSVSANDIIYEAHFIEGKFPFYNSKGVQLYPITGDNIGQINYVNGLHIYKFRYNKKYSYTLNFNVTNFNSFYLNFIKNGEYTYYQTTLTTSGVTNIDNYISDKDVEYIVIASNPVLDKILLEELEQNKNNGICSCLGDSICYGTTPEGVIQDTYMKLTADYYNYEYISYGLNSSCIGIGDNHNIVPSFCDRLSNIDSKTNYLLIEGGTNDWSHSTPLGTINDVTQDTFYGALNVIKKYMIDNLNSCFYAFIIPITRLNESNPNGQEHVLEDYRNAIKTFCETNRIKYIDINKECIFNLNNSNDRLIYGSDGVHPNTKGHYLLFSALKAKF